MATNSTSAQKNEQQEAAECPRCVALAECNADLLKALEKAEASLKNVVGNLLGIRKIAATAAINQARAAIARAT